jgi:hypothetical protein
MDCFDAVKNYFDLQKRLMERLLLEKAFGIILDSEI